MAYAGTLLGPPLIGGMAPLISLRGALGLLYLAAVTMPLVGGQVRRCLRHEAPALVTVLFCAYPVAGRAVARPSSSIFNSSPVYFSLWPDILRSIYSL